MVLNILEKSSTIPLNVGYMSVGWNFNFHQDGSVELMQPAQNPDDSFSVSNPVLPPIYMLITSLICKVFNYTSTPVPLQPTPNANDFVWYTHFICAWGQLLITFSGYTHQFFQLMPIKKCIGGQVRALPYRLPLILSVLLQTAKANNYQCSLLLVSLLVCCITSCYLLRSHPHIMCNTPCKPCRTCIG